MKIEIDDRESKGFQMICNTFFNECITNHLLVGDIIINNQICFEHKKPQDFLSSIFDGRLFKQIEQMKSNYRHNYIVVSGSMTDLIEISKNYDSTLAAIVSCFVRSCPVIFCDSQENLCVIVKKLSEKLLDGKNRTIPIIKIPIENDQLRLICSISGISKTKGKLLLDQFKTPNGVFNAQKNELLEIKGIGSKLADKIKDVLGKV